MKLCAILTCHNRRERTVRCIQSLLEIAPDAYIYAVDDGSNDGTGNRLAELIRAGEVIFGDGNLYWSRGMARAWQTARAAGDNSFDFTLWLNDDIELLPTALQELLECACITNNTAVITGLIRDKNSNEIIYGGSDLTGKLITSTGQMTRVTYMNGNCVLVPREVSDKIGIIDSAFHHDLGDVDYGLRSIRAGYNVFTTRDVVAYGEKNNICRVRKSGTTARNRLRQLYSPLGSPPHLNFRYRRRHYGILNALGYYVFLHALNVIPDSLCRSLFGQRYI